MIWAACNGVQHIEPIHGLLFRMVESQEQIATLSYVDTFEEQCLLEELLEGVKPAYPDASTDYHYLLKTPFRYPPLKWGSRFGRTHEPSIFYGAASVKATLAESAYYRFIFWFSMAGEPVKDKLRSEHTLFSVGYKTERGVKLQAAPFAAYQADLTHPSNYLSSQLLGTAMRESGVEAFEYQSARDPAKGLCIGLFALGALAQKRPLDTFQWLCEVSANEVAFMQVGSREITVFAADQIGFSATLDF